MARLVGGGRQQQPPSSAVAEAPTLEREAPFSADDFDYAPFQSSTYQVGGCTSRAGVLCAPVADGRAPRCRRGTR